MGRPASLLELEASTCRMLVDHCRQQNSAAVSFSERELTSLPEGASTPSRASRLNLKIPLQTTQCSVTAGLSSLISLRSLDCSFNQLESLRQQELPKQVTSLSLTSNQLSDLKPTRQLKTLLRLHASVNRCEPPVSSLSCGCI